MTESPNDLGFHLQGSGGKGVLLIHGMTGAPSEMKFLARELNRRGFTVHVPMLAGHGGDKAALLRTGWRDWLRTVEHAYEMLQAEVATVYAAGICAGGALSVALAARRPKLAGIAVLSTTFAYDGWNMKSWYGAAPLINLTANFPGLRAIDFAEPHPFGIKNERLRARIERDPAGVIEGALDRLPLGSLSQLYRLGRHVLDIAPSVRTPALLLHASDDDMSHPRNAEKLRARLGGPVELTFLHNSYHMIHVDQERRRVAELTADFFGAPERIGLTPAPQSARELAHA